MTATETAGIRAAVGRDMQRTREINMYGMPVEDIREHYIKSITAELSGLEMVVMGILSDSQELLSMGRNESARQQMNVAKYILGEMMDAKSSRI
jgi:hypothetical protein